MSGKGRESSTESAGCEELFRFPSYKQSCGGGRGFRSGIERGGGKSGIRFCLGCGRRKKQGRGGAERYRDTEVKEALFVFSSLFSGLDDSVYGTDALFHHITESAHLSGNACAHGDASRHRGYAD